LTENLEVEKIEVVSGSAAYLALHRRSSTQQRDCTAVVVYCIIVGPDGARSTSSLFQTGGEIYRDCSWLAAPLSCISPAGAFCKCFSQS